MKNWFNGWLVLRETKIPRVVGPLVLGVFLSGTEKRVRFSQNLPPISKCFNHNPSFVPPSPSPRCTGPWSARAMLQTSKRDVLRTLQSLISVIWCQIVVVLCSNIFRFVNMFTLCEEWLEPRLQATHYRAQKMLATWTSNQETFPEAVCFEARPRKPTQPPTPSTSSHFHSDQNQHRSDSLPRATITIIQCGHFKLGKFVCSQLCCGNISLNLGSCARMVQIPLGRVSSNQVDCGHGQSFLPRVVIEPEFSVDYFVCFGQSSTLATRVQFWPSLLWSNLHLITFTISTVVNFHLEKEEGRVNFYLGGVNFYLGGEGEGQGGDLGGGGGGDGGRGSFVCFYFVQRRRRRGSTL